MGYIDYKPIYVKGEKWKYIGRNPYGEKLYEYSETRLTWSELKRLIERR